MNLVPKTRFCIQKKYLRQIADGTKTEEFRENKKSLQHLARWRRGDLVELHYQGEERLLVRVTSNDCDEPSEAFKAAWLAGIGRAFSSAERRVIGMEPVAHYRICLETKQIIETFELRQA